MKNKKRLSAIVVAGLISISMLAGCQKKEEGMTTIRLNEVTHSVFYAPQYVAMELGFFEQEGLQVQLSNGQGADKSMTALVSGSADVALLGTEAGIYVYNEGKENYAVSFAQPKCAYCVKHSTTMTRLSSPVSCPCPCSFSFSFSFSFFSRPFSFPSFLLCFRDPLVSF